MKPNDYARIASAAAALALELRPTREDAAHADARNLAVYFLNKASKIAQAIGEDMPK